MSCIDTTITAIVDRNNPQTWVFGTSTGGVVSVFDWSEATLIEAEIYSTAGVLLDTLNDTDDAAVFDVTAGDGEIDLDFGLSGLSAGSYYVRLIATTATYPSGLAWDRGDTYTFDLVVSE